MVSIAAKNLFHDRVRLIVALLGVQLAVVLITIQIGVLLSFIVTSSVIIDQTKADLWITAKNVQNFDFSRPISEKKLYQAREVNGVLWAQNLLLVSCFWKTPGGGQEGVQIVGFNPDTLVGAPWDLIEGNLDEARYFNAVYIDEAERNRLGSMRIGDRTEINGREVRVAGITRGAKGFIQNPYVFMAFQNGKAIANIDRDSTVYVVVKVAPGEDQNEVRDRLQKTISDVDVYTKAEFSLKTRKYWLINTGAGIALFGTTLMALIIGIVIVGQTIYASTVDHIKEFGTLKAIGAANSDVYKIIVQQALITALIGYLLGMLTTYFVIKLMAAGKLNVYLPWYVIVAIFFITAGMCVSSSIISIFKVTRIDPALVFKS